jgi:uncharacterized membrane protein
VVVIVMMVIVVMMVVVIVMMVLMVMMVFDLRHFPQTAITYSITLLTHRGSNL